MRNNLSAQRGAIVPVGAKNGLRVVQAGSHSRGGLSQQLAHARLGDSKEHSDSPQLEAVVQSQLHHASLALGQLVQCREQAPAVALFDQRVQWVGMRDWQEAERLARRTRVAEAGGQLVAAAFTFLGEMIPQRASTNGADTLAKEFKARIDECLERDEQGRPRLTVTLPNEAALENLTRWLGALLG